jgi:hypothetical protein
MNDTFYTTLDVLNVFACVGWSAVIVAATAFTASVVKHGFTKEEAK